MPSAWGNSPSEKAMGALIHDTNQNMADVRHNLKNLSKWFEENKPALKEAGIDIMPYVKSTVGMEFRIKDLRESIDEYYRLWSKDFKEEESN